MNIRLSSLDLQRGGDLNGNFFELLQKIETSIPLLDLFVVKFDIPNLLSEEFHNTLGEYPASYNTNINKVIELFGDATISQNAGFALCHGVKTPGEKNSTKKLGNEINGYLPLSVIEKREYGFNTLTIDVIETVVSFTDFVFKPWIRLLSRYGNFSDNPLNTNIEVLHLERSPSSSSFFNFLGNNKPSIRKHYTFYNCVPTDVDGETNLYGNNAGIIKKAVAWKFERYTIKLPIV